MNLYLTYSVIKLNGGLFSMEHVRWGRQLWSVRKVHKEHHCVMTGVVIKKGSLAYLPITNKGNRHERIAKAFFEANR